MCTAGAETLEEGEQQQRDAAADLKPRSLGRGEVALVLALILVSLRVRGLVGGVSLKTLGRWGTLGAVLRVGLCVLLSLLCPLVESAVWFPRLGLLLLALGSR